MAPVDLRAPTLIVRNLAVMTDFYHRIIGLDVLSEGSGKAPSTGRGSRSLCWTRTRRCQRDPRDWPACCIQRSLYETPAQLASGLGRVARFTPQLYTGSGDHHVSQAFYLDDPTGNGVELCVDRPSETWLRGNGRLHVTTRYINPTEFTAPRVHGRGGDGEAGSRPPSGRRHRGTAPLPSGWVSSTCPCPPALASMLGSSPPPSRSSLIMGGR